jgi:hypothetical protein
MNSLSRIGIVPAVERAYANSMPVALLIGWGR